MTFSADDPTLLAVDRALEAQPSWRSRSIGMSAIGKECSRALWYSYRWVDSPPRPARLIKAAASGHVDEPIMADRLRLVLGVELETLDPRTGRQFLFTSHDGHLKGYCDGKVLGLLQAPKTKHIWEHKSRDVKYVRSLTKLKAEYGEKNALFQWDQSYWGQAQEYMGHAGLTRHYLTCSTGRVPSDGVARR